MSRQRRKRGSFWASLPGVLTALGTLIAACGGVIALFVTTGSGNPPSSSKVAATVTSARANQTGGTSSRDTSGSSTSIGTSSSSNSGGRSGGGGFGGGSSGGGGGSGGGGAGGGSGPIISEVGFMGNTAAPTVVVTGNGFGSAPPAGQPDNSTSCGGYTNNGDDYGAADLWFEDVGNFAAGNGIPPNGSCIGIIVLSWSNDKVMYQFGNAYKSFDHWHISDGDQYSLWVKGVQYSGTVSFSS